MSREEEKVVIRAMRPGDVEAVLAGRREVMWKLEKEEIISQLFLFIHHPYFFMLVFLTPLLLYYFLQMGVGACLVSGTGLVVVVEGFRFLLFWRNFRDGYGAKEPDILNLVHYYSHTRRSFLVAVVEGEVAGTVAVRETDDPNMAELSRLVVHLKFRRRGIALRLIQACHREAGRLDYTAVMLRTPPNNRGALKCYQKAGYIQYGIENVTRMYPHKFDLLKLIWKI
ncbi:uncharacterized protein LOC121865169 isoform X1 [Homarus americanus]|uniref:N-acetyltransferase family 8 member 2-like n=1 Tax=Homarus americanus TaxID=6706 RepID=A0A8J5N081_HOMAM|nr:uncharacterized protein LOC121865169 isoform X1 [Homarus americanus]KAG7169956.1 N-acetyltransferase family 8 member 2-like [Homarus americanus]